MTEVDVKNEIRRLLKAHPNANRDQKQTIADISIQIISRVELPVNPGRPIDTSINENLLHYSLLKSIACIQKESIAVLQPKEDDVANVDEIGDADFITFDNDGFVDIDAELEPDSEDEEDEEQEAFEGNTNLLETLPLLLFASTQIYQQGNDGGDKAEEIIAHKLRSQLPPRGILSLMVADLLIVNARSEEQVDDTEVANDESSSQQGGEDRSARVLQVIRQYYGPKNDTKLRKLLQVSARSNISLFQSLLEARALRLQKWFTLHREAQLLSPTAPSLPIEYCEDFVLFLCGKHAERKTNDIDPDTVLGFEGWDEFALPRLKEVFSSLTIFALTEDISGPQNHNETSSKQGTLPCHLLNMLVTTVGLRWLCGIPLNEVVKTGTEETTVEGAKGTVSSSYVVHPTLIRSTVMKRGWLPKWASQMLPQKAPTVEITSNDTLLNDIDDEAEGAAERQARQLSILLLRHLQHCIELQTLSLALSSSTAPQPLSEHIANTATIIISAVLPYMPRVWVAWAPEEQWEVMSAVGNTLLTDSGVFSRVSGETEGGISSSNITSNSTSNDSTSTVLARNVLVEAAGAADPKGVWLAMWLTSAHIRWLARSGGSFVIGEQIDDNVKRQKSWITRVLSGGRSSHTGMEGPDAFEPAQQPLSPWGAMIRRCLE